MRRRPGRARARRAGSDTVLKGARPGADHKRSLAKALGPGGQASLKRARKLAKAGDFDGSATLFVQLAERLDREGKPGLAARAMLRAARVLHRGGRVPGARKAITTAIGYGKKVQPPKVAIKHFRMLVQGLRARGKTGIADEVEAEVRAAFGRERLGRPRGRRRGAAKA